MAENTKTGLHMTTAPDAHMAATITRLEGEALVLRELLRRALDPLMTIDEPESHTELLLLSHLIEDIQTAIRPHQVDDVVQRGMF